MAQRPSNSLQYTACLPLNNAFTAIELKHFLVWKAAHKKGVYSSSMQRELQAWQYCVVQHLYMHMHEMPCICNEFMATWAASGVMQGGQWR